MKNGIFKTIAVKGIDTFARINRDIVAGIWQTALSQNLKKINQKTKMVIIATLIVVWMV